MARKRLVTKGSFRAHSRNGEEFIVFIFQEMGDVSKRSDPDETETKLTLQLIDGRPVTRIDKGSYEIVGVPTIPLTSADPKAP